MTNLQGKYREHAPAGLLDQVYVAYGSYGFPVSEAYYQVHCFRPDLAALPWKEDYRTPQGSAPTD
jgi:hypothetical protein